MKTKTVYGADPGITTWLDNAGKFPRISAESINEIAKQIQSLPENSAKRKQLVGKLVNHNLLLVASFVKRFMDSKSHNKWGCPETVDYLQVGAIGLMRAAEKFDPKRGYTFSTYATHWMRSAVGRYNLKTMTSVHVSESASRKFLYYKRNGKISAHGDAREARPGEIRLLEQLLSNAYTCLSLDASFTEDGSPLIEAIAQPERTSSNWRHIYTSLREVGIKPVEIQVLKCYYVENKTISEIADRMSISVQEVRQHKKRAMATTGRRASDMPW